jgi:hypothetical protein
MFTFARELDLFLLNLVMTDTTDIGKQLSFTLFLLSKLKGGNAENPVKE